MKVLSESRPSLNLIQVRQAQNPGPPPFLEIDSSHFATVGKKWKVFLTLIRVYALGIYVAVHAGKAIFARTEVQSMHQWHSLALNDHVDKQIWTLK